MNLYKRPRAFVAAALVTGTCAGAIVAATSAGSGPALVMSYRDGVAAATWTAPARSHGYWTWDYMDGAPRASWLVPAGKAQSETYFLSPGATYAVVTEGSDAMLTAVAPVNCEEDNL